MRFVPLVSGIGIAAALIGGCGRYERETLNRPYAPATPRSTVMAPDVPLDEFTARRLSGLPGGVQAAFRQDHPSASITRVDPVPTGVGPIIYRIAYLEDGSSGSATYRASGREMDDATPQVIQPDDSGRPRAKYPATQQSADRSVPRDSHLD